MKWLFIPSIVIVLVSLYMTKDRPTFDPALFVVDTYACDEATGECSCTGYQNCQTMQADACASHRPITRGAGEVSQACAWRHATTTIVQDTR